MKKNNDEYAIDYEIFTVEEVVKIINFMHLIEQTKTKRVNKEKLITDYKEYRHIINNISLEKQYDKMLLAKSNVSIYQVMKKVMENK